MTDQTPILSTTGHARKQTMRSDLLIELGRVQRHRRARRQIAGSVAIVALVVGANWLAWARWTPSATQIAQTTNEEIVRIVRTDAAVTAPWIVRTEPSMLADATRAIDSTITIERIDDVELVTQLAALGKTTGIARSGERVWLTDDIFAQR